MHYSDYLINATPRIDPARTHLSINRNVHVMVLINTSFLANLWMFFVPLLAILAPVWLGKRFGAYTKKKSGPLPDGPLSSMVGASLGLLAFMLAFIFQIVGGRYEKRKQLLLEEVSDIRSSFLYAGLVPEPIRTSSRKMIITYVNTRIDLGYHPTPEKLKEAKIISQRILDSLWVFSENLAELDRDSEMYVLYTASISKLATLFNERIAIGLNLRLHLAILYVMSIVSFLSMLMLGFQFGIAGGESNMVILVLGIIFSVVMWLIFALDRPEEGLIKVNPTPMLILQEQLNSGKKI